MDPTATPPRHRGGQPGNRNARGDGFYTRARLTSQQLDLLAVARVTGSLPDDIDLLRTEIARLVRRGDYDAHDLAALSRALTSALALDAKLTTKGQRDGLQQAVDAVLADVELLRKGATEQEPQP